MNSSQKHSSSSKSLDIISPPWRLALCVGGAGAILIILWSFLARIPIRVQGRGVFFPLPAASRFITSDYGRVHVFLPNTNETSPEWFQLILPDLINRAKLSPDQLQKFISLLINNLSTEEANEQPSDFIQRNYPIHIPPNQLIIYSESTTKKATLLSNLGKYSALRLQADSNLNLKTTLRGELAQQLSLRASLQKSLDHLSNIQFLPKTAALTNRTEIDSLKSQISSLEAEYLQIKTNTKLAESELRSSLNDFIDSTLFYSQKDLYIQQLASNSSDYKSPDSTLLSYTSSLQITPRHIPVFFAANNITQLSPGNTGFASVKGYPRTRFGGIKLEILNRNNLSSTAQEVANGLGLEGFSEDVSKNFIAPTLAIARLQMSKPFNKSDPYQWTIKSRTKPSLQLGDILDVEVTVRKVAPIEFVIPTIKSVFGLTPKPPKSAKPSVYQK